MTAVATLVAAAAVGVAGPAVAAAPPSASADSMTLLPDVTDVADTAAGGGRVFVSAEDRVIVADATGAITDTVTGLAGANGLASTPSGDRLYVALYDSGEVAEIDPSTAKVTRKIDVGRRCPRHLALSGSRLWIGYGCEGVHEGGVLTLDVAAATPTVAAIIDNTFGAPAVAVAGGVLALGETDLHPSVVHVYSVDGQQATERGTIEVPTLNDLALTPDGSLLVVAWGADFLHFAYDTTTLAEVRRYGDSSSAWATAAAFSSDGRHLAAGHRSPDGPALVIHDTANGTVVNTARPERGYLVGGAVSFLGNDAFAVMEGAESFWLWRVADATLPASAISLTAPASGTALDPLRITGRLTLADGAAPGVQELQVTRTIPDGTWATLSVTTAADGTFTLTDVPPLSGQIRYDVYWNPTADYQRSTASVTVPVDGRTATLTLGGPSNGRDGSRLSLSGVLGLDGKAPEQPQTLAVTRTIWNNRLDGAVEQLPNVTTDSRGAFTILDTPSQGGRHVYTVTWHGDSVYASPSASHEVAVTSADSHIAGQVAEPAYIGVPLRVTGAVTYDVGVCQGPTVVQLSRRINGGAAKRLPDVTTDASCGFGFDDTVGRTGPVTYTVAWDGNSTQRRTTGAISVTVQKQPSFIEATSPDRTLLNGQQAVIEGTVTDLHGESISGRLKLTVQRIGPDGSSLTLPSVTTAADGTFSYRDSPPTMDASTYPQFQYEFSWSGTATYRTTTGSVFFYIVPPECGC
ncbi:YncE family protein [Micromonospora sp. DT231]|uniref:YncE family protein n=1 Tax=Micromonospora sp. DT231 TaxID=3416526 RepID=UPI003CF6F6DC